MKKASETRRELIERTALQLFAEKGYAETSVKDIAHACGIGDSALYRHMESKEELAIRVFRAAYLEFAEKMQHAAENASTLETTLRAYLKVVLEGFDEDPALVRFLLIQQHDILAQAITPDDVTPLILIRDIIVKSQGSSRVKFDDPDMAVAMVMGAALQPLTFIMFGRLPAPAISHHQTILAGITRMLGIAQ